MSGLRIPLDVWRGSAGPMKPAVYSSTCVRREPESVYALAQANHVVVTTA